MNQTFITLTKALLLEKEGKSPISNFFLKKRIKNRQTFFIYWDLLAFPPSTNLHLLFGIFCFAKTTCSYSSLLQVFARVEQQIKTPLRCSPLRPNSSSSSSLRGSAPVSRSEELPLSPMF